MTPLEINKKISELKKLDPPFYEMPNWTKRIEDALELFEEMPNSFSICSLPNGFYAVYSYIYNPPIMAVEKTTPLAICKAWLKWKERKTK